MITSITTTTSTTTTTTTNTITHSKPKTPISLRWLLLMTNGVDGLTIFNGQWVAAAGVNLQTRLMANLQRLHSVFWS